MTAVLDPSKYRPDRSLPAKIGRRMTQWRAAQPMLHTPEQAIVSFTFDDFPKSAVEHGASALEAIGALGTFYACTGMLGHENIMGQLYTAEDLDRLRSAGHEIAAHTQTHLDCGQVSADTVRGEITENITNLKALVPDIEVSDFAWPYGETTYKAKASVGDLVTTGRGILPGINRKGSDLMQLRSCELTPQAATIKRAKQAIEKAVLIGGWVTIFTHDIRSDPSPFGTTPEAFMSLAKFARDSGARILPMQQAFRALQKEARA